MAARPRSCSFTGKPISTTEAVNAFRQSPRRSFDRTTTHRRDETVPLDPWREDEAFSGWRLSRVCAEPRSTCSMINGPIFDDGPIHRRLQARIQAAYIGRRRPIRCTSPCCAEQATRSPTFRTASFGDINCLTKRSGTYNPATSMMACPSLSGFARWSGTCYHGVS